MFTFRTFLRTQTGLFIACTLILLWSFSTAFAFQVHWDSRNPFLYIWILIQMHLYTGLFITAHDAMHGTVSRNRGLNNLIGWICTLAYACFPYSKLYKKHHEHHRFVHTEQDPDFSERSFFLWYMGFFFQYFSIYQYLLLNGLFFFYNLVLKVPQVNLILFWIVPSVLSSLQLFYFGTYAPHKGEPGNIHQARTQTKNHVLAFITCYFFGYHFEHHDAPYIPWWQLHKLKA